MTTMTVDQFTGRTEAELLEMALARNIEVPADADAAQLRRALRNYTETCHTQRAGEYRFGREPDDLEERVDTDVRRAMEDGALWTVSALRRATLHSGEEVRASLLRLGARGDGTGAYYLPATQREGTAASGDAR